MTHTRRDFIKTVGAAGLVVAGSDLIADLLAQTPPGRVMDSKFKGLSDIALKEAKAAGCSYADIRFTRSTSSGVNANGGNPVPGQEDEFGGFGAAGRAGAAGFGVRVIHSGTWGFASSPIVTEDEIRRITRLATEVARSSAIAKKQNLRLAPVPAYVENWISPMQKPPMSVSQTDKTAWAQAIVDKAKAVQGVTAVNVSATHSYEWRYFAS